MNIASALAHLASAGITRKALAHEVKVHLSAVHRWTKGTAPRAKNLASIRDLVDILLAEATAKDIQVLADRQQIETLQAAKAALTSPEGAAAIEATEQVQPPVSITAKVDPFTLLGRQTVADNIDAAFAA